MGAGDDILRTMTENMATFMHRMDAVEAKLDKLSAHLGATRPPGPSGGGDTGGRVATSQEIAGERGDPKIRMMPKSWKGESFKGLRASQCSPDFLDVYAEQLDWFASKNEDAKKAGWDRLDAARCRRWAVEIREGRVTPAARPTPQSAGAPLNDDGDPWATGGAGDVPDW